MDRKTVIRENLVDRYVRGELSPEEERRFEEFYLTDQWAQRELAATLSLRQALKNDRAANDAPSGNVTPLARRRRVSARPWAAAAGLAAAAVLAGGTGYWLGSNEPASSEVAPLHNLQRLELIETRGAANSPEFDLVTDQPVLLVVELGYTGDGPLTATLRTLPGKTPVHVIDNAFLDQYGRMSAALPNLDPGSYRLELEETDSGNLVSWFTFQVR